MAANLHMTASLRPWRTVRVFISSTFRDMHAERDHLVRVVFPALRERLARHRVSLIDIDLRWGVTRAQAENEQTVGLCLGLVDECRPFFLGLLGERYGYVPARLLPDVLERLPWLSQLAGKSVTEMEMLHGVLNNPGSGHALFCLRDPEATHAVRGPQRAAYVDSDPHSVHNLAHLKERIRASGLPRLDPYPCNWDAAAQRMVGLEAFGEVVRDWLWSAIEAELALPAEPLAEALGDPLAEEADDQERFLEARLRVYVGREEYQRALSAYARGSDNRPCLVTGPAGCGKSSVLARFVAQHRASSPQMPVLPHFVGAGPRSTSLRNLLRRLCGELQTLTGFTDELPAGTDPLARRLRELLLQAPPVVLVLDALDQLDPADQAHALHWLPEHLPPHVKVVASSATGPGVPEELATALEGRPFARVEVGPLDDEERWRIIRDVPGAAAKTLDEQQVGLLLGNPATRNPLFLLVALEELRVFGSFEELSDRIASLPCGPDAVTALFGQVLQRLEVAFDTSLVRKVLSLLASARRGLSEGELRRLTDTLAGADDLYPVLRQLRPYLLDRSGLLDFYHRNLLQAVEHRYLGEADARHAAHVELADFFAARERDGRVVEELPWHLAEAGQWHRLADILGEPTFFDVAWQQDPFEVKGFWARVEAHSALRLVEAYRPVAEGPERFAPDTVGRVATLLADTGHPAEALALRRYLVSHHRQTGDRAHLAGALSNVALLCKGRGEMDSAQQLLQEAEEIWRSLGNRHGLQTVLGNRARLLMSMGDLEGAMSRLEEGERLCRELGHEQGLQIALGSQAQVWLMRGDHDRAEGLLRERERICRRLGNPHGLQVALANLALVSQARGDLAGAMELLKESERICRDLGNTHGLQITLGSQARVLQAQGDAEGALALLQEQERICRELGNPVGLQIALANRGLVLRGRGEAGPALALFREAEGICRRIRHPEGLALALHHQAEVLAEDFGRPEEALPLAEEAHRRSREHGLAALVALIEPLLERLKNTGHLQTREAGGTP